MKTIHIDDGDALNIDCVVVNQVDSKDCKCFYSCDLIDQYEARLKADLVAMLEDLDSEIDELTYKKRPFTWDDTGEKGMMDIKPSINDIRGLIQERINALRVEIDLRDLIAELQEVPDEALDAISKEVDYFVGLSDEERINALKEDEDGEN